MQAEETRTAPPPEPAFHIQHSAFPRSRFPGDVLLQLRTDTLGFLTRTARTYGDAVPFRAWNWRYLLLNDPEAIRDVLVTRAGQFLKGPALRRATSTLGQGLLTSEGDFHRRQRRRSIRSGWPGTGRPWRKSHRAPPGNGRSSATAAALTPTRR
jgi:cytochrome P450